MKDFKKNDKESGWTKPDEGWTQNESEPFDWGYRESNPAPKPEVVKSEEEIVQTIYAVQSSLWGDPSSYDSFHLSEKTAEEKMMELISQEPDADKFEKREIVLTGRDGDVHTGTYEYTNGSVFYRVVPIKVKE